MEKLSITLTGQMLEHVQTQVQSGRFASTSEYIRDALRDRIALDEEAAVMKARLVRAKDDLKNGKTISHEDAFDMVEARIKRVADGA